MNTAPTVMINNLPAATMTSQTEPCKLIPCVPNGPGVILQHKTCGKVIEPALVCPECGEALHPRNVRALPGPGAMARDAAAG